MRLLLLFLAVGVLAGCSGDPYQDVPDDELKAARERVKELERNSPR
jgi:uncharacterized lipoprotein